MIAFAGVGVRSWATAAAAVLVLFYGVSIAGCSDDDDKGELVLVWSDEFDGTAGQAPDPDRWTYDVGGDGWGNAQLEYDTDRIENVVLDGQGHLLIVAREEEFAGRAYTSGRINTRDRFAHAYGRFEARIQLPVGQGIWPAFWLLGDNFGEVGWPKCGEIDIMEYRGQEPWKVHGSVHGPGYSGGNAVTRSHELSSGGFDEAFHVFAVEWTESRITWFVDDVAYHRVRPQDLPGGGAWVFDHSFFIILNVAVGGNFVGSPDASTTFPQTMRIDYVRVYARR